MIVAGGLAAAALDQQEREERPGSSATILSAQSSSTLGDMRHDGEISRLLAFGSGAVDPMITDHHFLNNDQGPFPKAPAQFAALLCNIKY